MPSLIPDVITSTRWTVLEHCLILSSPRKPSWNVFSLIFESFTVFFSIIKIKSGPLVLRIEIFLKIVTICWIYVNVQQYNKTNFFSFWVTTNSKHIFKLCCWIIRLLVIVHVKSYVNDNWVRTNFWQKSIANDKNWIAVQWIW